jgi:Fe-S-cluster containining protein
MYNPEPLPTLPFSEWLRAIGAATRAGTGMDVACGDCRGCCTSSYFIPVGPDEADALAAIPKRLLFKAPGMPKGHYLLAYAGNGHCAMFKDNACSIYAHRPRACRAYDCRLFAATGLSEEGKPAIARQADRWRFDFPAAEDRRLFDAVRAAARFLREHAADFPQGFLPANATQQAGLALRVHGLFLGDGKVAAETIAGIVETAGGKATAKANAHGSKTGSRARKQADDRPGNRPEGQGEGQGEGRIGPGSEGQRRGKEAGRKPDQGRKKPG